MPSYTSNTIASMRQMMLIDGLFWHQEKPRGHEMTLSEVKYDLPASILRAM